MDNRPEITRVLRVGRNISIAAARTALRNCKQITLGFRYKLSSCCTGWAGLRDVLTDLNSGVEAQMK